MADWIEDFLSFTAGLPSPRIFRLWAGITAVSGALERRVWVMSAGKPIYPNLYVLLVATPGVGKNVIQETHNLWFAAKKFKVAPDSITRAGLIDALAEAGTTIIKGTDLLEYHTMLVASTEFGVLVPAYDLDFLSSLNRIFDNPPSHVERRRWVNQGKNIEISNPQLTLIAGTQPGYLSALLPEEAWTMGTTSRLIMVYAAEPVPVQLHLEQEGLPNGHYARALRTEIELASRLAALHDRHGAMPWTQAAAEAFTSWYAARCPPIPTHSKLLHYIPRRHLHVIKLCAISAASRGAFVISLDDVTRAQDWLFEAERAMPDIFREMSQRSDKQIIEELHLFLWQSYSKDKKALHESHLIHFLQSRVPSEKVLRVLEIAERANFVIRDAGTQMYRPRPMHERGVE